MDVILHDKVIEVLQEEIKNNQMFVLQKIIQLEKTKNENDFLTVIFEDYQKHYNFIINQKQEQKRQMEYLIHYLDKAIEDLDLSEEKLKETHQEQDHILGKLDKVKKDLDEFINYNKMR